MKNETIAVPFETQSDRPVSLIGKSILMNQAIFRVHCKANSIVTDDPIPFPNPNPNTYYWCELTSAIAFIGNVELIRGSRIILPEFLIQKYLVDQSDKEVI